MTDDGAVVPPGHKVVVVQPTKTPDLFQMASGVWVVNFGEGRFVPALLKATAELVSRGGRTSIMWVLAGDVLDSLDDPEALLEAAAGIVKRSKGRAIHLAVFPDDVPCRSRFMRDFRSHGFGVHFGGADRACFVEVHKPDGSIVVGMAGPALGTVNDG